MRNGVGPGYLRAGESATVDFLIPSETVAYSQVSSLALDRISSKAASSMTWTSPKCCSTGMLSLNNKG
jgi:hypothetical protein